MKDNFHSQTAPKARKHNTCHECQGVIQPGEIYHKRTGCHEGAYYTMSTCADCEALFARVNAELARDGVTIGRLRDALRFLSEIEPARCDWLSEFRANATRRRGRP